MNTRSFSTLSMAVTLAAIASVALGACALLPPEPAAMTPEATMTAAPSPYPHLPSQQSATPTETPTPPRPAVQQTEEPTPKSTAPECSQPETRVTVNATPSFLEVSDLLIVTYKHSNFANILNASLIVNSSVIAVQRQSGELEIHDSSTFQVLQTRITATGTGEWLLQANAPGNFDIQVRVYGDTGFFSYIDGKCIPGTTHKMILSDAAAVNVSSSAVHLTPSSAAGLTIEEYPLAAASVIEPSFDLVAIVPEKVLARREGWRQVIPRCVPGIYGCPPYVIGEHAYTVELIDVLHYNVREDGTLVYTISATETPPDPGAHMALLDWQGQWVLEFNNRVIIDGTSFSEQHGYDRVFNWRVVHGELFYFFEQDGRVHVSYGGETLPQTYAEVAHNLCCEPAVCNVQTYADMVAFYARKEGTWFYVEMGVYD
jgi:hypothetical protein